MKHILDFIEGISVWTGKSFAWCILILALATTYEVFVRYVLRDPTAWAFDISYMMYGALFMMAGAYTLSRDAHVRGDVIFRLWPPRMQAAIEITLLFLFLFPGMAALVYAGTDYAMDSWRWKEASINSPIGIPVYPLKTLLPIAAAAVFLQGIVEVGRCIRCLRTGQWPPRAHDVEETETAILQQVEHERKRMAEMAALRGISVEELEAELASQEVVAHKEGDPR
ncbi:TRAP transporter small permease subunit [Shumkonia mesophila]|uniref:TRAP transporter small permease subunit n=1 Tax=Shumkonia mesophila TaxID=2838854 RepID=UPI002934F88A|nr:TRAP transporter small permease subunit [Shumkonia mesophila]